MLEIVNAAVKQRQILCTGANAPVLTSKDPANAGSDSNLWKDEDHYDSLDPDVNVYMKRRM